MFPFRPTFCKFFSLIGRWGPLTHFSITNLYLQSGSTVGVLNISPISMVLCLYLLHLKKIFPIANSFWNKNIVKHYLAVVK